MREQVDAELNEGESQGEKISDLRSLPEGRADMKQGMRTEIDDTVIRNGCSQENQDSPFSLL